MFADAASSGRSALVPGGFSSYESLKEAAAGWDILKQALYAHLRLSSINQLL